MTQTKSPGRRRKAPELRKVSVNTSMTLEQREMFLELGGSGWLQKQMDLHIQKRVRLSPERWQYHPETRAWTERDPK